MWAEDVAECVLAVLPGGSAADEAAGTRYELAGPETVSYLQLASHVMHAHHRRRPLMKVPRGVVRRGLKVVEVLMGPAAFATWDEAELLEISLISRLGTADAERLGVQPKPLRAVLDAG